MTTAVKTGWLANSPLRHRLFLGVWIGSICLGFGNQIQLVGASWAMTEMTHSPRMVALVTFALNAPLLLFSMAFGALSDLHDKRKVILAAYAIMGSGAAALALLGYTGNLQPGLLLLLTFVMGTGFALNMPSWQSSVRELVPMEELSSA
ncbi:MAG: MFS transporter, partial [Anaerolineae bacterium]|nr:MFS transporter [Anaerolineae bacterium]